MAGEGGDTGPQLGHRIGLQQHAIAAGAMLDQVVHLPAAAEQQRGDGEAPAIGEEVLPARSGKEADLDQQQIRPALQQFTGLLLISAGDNAVPLAAQERRDVDAIELFIPEE